MYAKGLQLIEVSEDRVVLKRGVHELMLRGAGTRDILETLISLLDGTRKRAQIVDAFPGDIRPTIDQLLTKLVRRGLVFDSAEQASELLADDSLRGAYFRNFLPASAQVGEHLRQASVVLVGVNLIARSLARSLLECGIGSVWLVDHPILSNSLAPRGWIESLEPEDSWRLFDALPDRETLADRSLLCATSDLGGAEALMEVNRLALQLELPFLPIWLAELLGHVGPLNYPYETACLRCYRLRSDSNDENWEIKRAVNAFVADGGEAGRSAGLIPPMPGILGEIGAMEIVKTLGELVPSDVVGRQIEINLTSFGSAVRRILKVPRCPDCSEQTRQAAMALTRGPQIAQRA